MKDRSDCDLLGGSVDGDEEVGKTVRATIPWPDEPCDRRLGAKRLAAIAAALNISVVDLLRRRNATHDIFEADSPILLEALTDPDARLLLTLWTELAPEDRRTLLSMADSLITLAQRPA